MEINVKIQIKIPNKNAFDFDTIFDSILISDKYMFLQNLICIKNFGLYDNLKTNVYRDKCSTFNRHDSPQP